MVPIHAENQAEETSTSTDAQPPTEGKINMNTSSNTPRHDPSSAPRSQGLRVRAPNGGGHDCRAFRAQGCWKNRIKSPIVADPSGNRDSASIGSWSRFVASLVSGVLIASSGWARAGGVGVVVPPAQFDLVADGFDSFPRFTPGTVTGINVTYEAQPGVLTGRATSTATALIAAGPPQSGSPLPMPEADVHAVTFGTAGIPGSLPAGAASVNINYWFTVLPVGNGTLGTPVPLIVEASGSVGVSNPKYASAHVAFSFNDSGVQISKSLTTSNTSSH